MTIFKIFKYRLYATGTSVVPHFSIGLVKNTVQGVFGQLRKRTHSSCCFIEIFIGKKTHLVR